MDIVLNRRGGVPLHDQLLAQLELKILSGGIVPGQRLMSWSRPAGTGPRPEGLGYLLFSDGPIAPPPRPAVAN